MQENHMLVVIRILAGELQGYLLAEQRRPVPALLKGGAVSEYWTNFATTNLGYSPLEGLKRVYGG